MALRLQIGLYLEAIGRVIIRCPESGIDIRCEGNGFFLPCTTIKDKCNDENDTKKYASIIKSISNTHRSHFAGGALVDFTEEELLKRLIVEALIMVDHVGYLQRVLGWNVGVALAAALILTGASLD